MSNPDSAGNERIWGMMRATWEQRAVIEGHGAGLTKLDEINDFAAAGLSSDHKVKSGEVGIENLLPG